MQTFPQQGDGGPRLQDLPLRLVVFFDHYYPSSKETGRVRILAIQVAALVLLFNMQIEEMVGILH